jgi:hypothetical protein
MVTLNWKLLKEYKIDHPRQITTPWLLVLDAVRESTHLEVKAAGRWTPAGGLLGECEPDGLLDAAFQTERFVPDCPVGALIGKIGGSSASLTPVWAKPANPPDPAKPADPPPKPPVLAEDRSFAIGSYCVIALPDKSIGPLYISFNGLIRPVAVTQLTVTISGATPTT